MMEHEYWQWQEPGRAWKGAALYHFTLTVGDRRPVLGRLEIPDGEPVRAWVCRSPFGDALVDCLLSIPAHHPEVQVLHFCLMPDHLHPVLYVRLTMDRGVGTLARGFWQAAKKLGRACSYSGRLSLPRMTFGGNSKKMAHNKIGKMRAHGKGWKKRAHEGRKKRARRRGLRMQARD